MNHPHYQFVRMNLERSLGFDRPPFDPIVDFGPGLNIVTGPNGIGKSTLLRVMRDLLHGKHLSPQVAADAIVQAANERWELILSQGTLIQRRAGNVESAILPGKNPELSDSYFFALHELLQADGDTTVFIERVREEMHGGIDLQRAYQESGAKGNFATAALKETRALVEAKQERDIVAKEIADNADILETIAELQELIDQEESLRATIRRYEEALHYREKQAELTTVLHTLKKYDQRIDKIHPGSREEFLGLKGAIEAANDEMENYRVLIAENEVAIAEHPLFATLSEDPKWKETLSDLVTELTDAHDELKHCGREYQHAQGAFTRTNDEISWLMADLPQGAQLQPALERLSKLASESERLRMQAAAAKQLLADLGEPKEAVDEFVEQVDRDLVLAAEALTGKRRGSVTLKGLSIISLIVALGASISSFAWPHFAGYIPLFVGAIPLIIYLWSKRSGKGVKAELAELYRRENLAVGEENTAARLYRILVERRERLIALQKQNERIASAEAKATRAQEAYETWLTNFSEAAKALSLSEHPSLEQAAFFNFSKTISQWLTAAGTLSAKEAAYKTATATYQEAAAALVGHGGLTEGGYASLIRAAGRLQESITAFEGLQNDLVSKKGEAARSQKRLKAAEKGVASFYEKLSIPQDEEAIFWRLVADAPQYETEIKKRNAIEGVLEQLSVEAKTLAEASSTEKLAELHGEYEGQMKALNESRNTLAQLRATYHRLTESDALALADRTWREKQADLEAHRQAAVQARVIDALFHAVESESQAQHQPDVVRKASRWLTRITRNHYALSVADGHFTADDLVSGKQKQIDELSSGTRIQLLFSVRMGFLELLEESTKVRFPLFFDELLANSDDERSLAIASSIAEIATERQVFYATAQADEVGKLLHVSESAVVLDLGERAVKRETTERPFIPATYSIPSVPEVVEEYDTYAEILNVSAPSLFEPIGRVHAWYLCTSSTELYALLNRGFHTAGQAGRSQEVYKRRLNLLSMAQRFAQQGKARPLEVADLISAPEVLRRGTLYWEQIQAFLEAGERTGNDLLEAIEDRTIQRLSEAARAALSEWLEEERYSSVGEELSFSAILDEISLFDPTFTNDSLEHLIVGRYLTALGLNI